MISTVSPNHISSGVIDFRNLRCADREEHHVEVIAQEQTRVLTATVTVTLIVTRKVTLSVTMISYSNGDSESYPDS